MSFTKPSPRTGRRVRLLSVDDDWNDLGDTLASAATTVNNPPMSPSVTMSPYFASTTMALPLYDQPLVSLPIIDIEHIPLARTTSNNILNSSIHSSSVSPRRASVSDYGSFGSMGPLRRRLGSSKFGKNLSMYKGKTFRGSREMLELIATQSDKRNVVILAEERAREAVMKRIDRIVKDEKQREILRRAEEQAKVEKQLRHLAGCRRHVRVCVKEEVVARDEIYAMEIFAFHHVESMFESDLQSFILRRRYKVEQARLKEKEERVTKLRAPVPVEQVHTLRSEFQRSVRDQMDSITALWVDKPSTPLSSSTTTATDDVLVQQIRSPRSPLQQLTMPSPNAGPVSFQTLKSRRAAAETTTAKPSHGSFSGLNFSTRLQVHNELSRPVSYQSSKRVSPTLRNEELSWVVDDHATPRQVHTNSKSNRLAPLPSVSHTLAVHKAHKKNYEKKAKLSALGFDTEPEEDLWHRIGHVKVHSVEDEILAATKIQKVWRGFCLRSQIWDYRHTQRDCAIGTTPVLQKLFSLATPKEGSLRTFSTALRMTRREAAALDVQSVFRGYCTRKLDGLHTLFSVLPPLTSPLSTACVALHELKVCVTFDDETRSAIVVQRVVRGYLVRRRFRAAVEDALHRRRLLTDPVFKLKDLDQKRRIVNKHAYNKTWRPDNAKAQNKGFGFSDVENEITAVYDRIDKRRAQVFTDTLKFKQECLRQQLRRDQQQRAFEEQTRASVRASLIREAKSVKLQQERTKLLTAREQLLRTRWSKHSQKQREEDKAAVLQTQRQRFQVEEERELEKILRHVELRQKYNGESLEMARNNTIREMPNASAKIGGTAFKQHRGKLDDGQAKNTTKSKATQNAVDLTMSLYEPKSHLLPVRILESRQDGAQSKRLLPPIVPSEIEEIDEDVMGDVNCCENMKNELPENDTIDWGQHQQQNINFPNNWSFTSSCAGGGGVSGFVFSPEAVEAMEEAFDDDELRQYALVMMHPENAWLLHNKQERIRKSNRKIRDAPMIPSPERPEATTALSGLTLSYLSSLVTADTEDAEDKSNGTRQTLIGLETLLSVSK